MIQHANHDIYKSTRRINGRVMSNGGVEFQLSLKGIDGCFRKFKGKTSGSDLIFS